METEGERKKTQEKSKQKKSSFSSVGIVKEISMGIQVLLIPWASPGSLAKSALLRLSSSSTSIEAEEDEEEKIFQSIKHKQPKQRFARMKE